MNRYIFIIILCSFLFNRSSGQGLYLTVDGEITYVTTGAFYIDTGKKSGVSIGDVVKVYRDSKLIGSGEVSHISSNSAVCNILDGIDFQPGDRIEILVRNTIPAETGSLTPPVISSESASRTQKSNTEGSVTAKVLYENNGSGQAYSRQQSFFSLNRRGFAGIPISLTATGNLYVTSNTGKTILPQINQLDVQYEKSAGNWLVSAGRILDVSSSGAGPTDGFKVSGELNTMNLSIITGVWDSPAGKKDLKNIVSVRWKQIPFHLSSLNIDIITRKYNNNWDNFFSFSSTILHTQKWHGSAGGLIHIFDGSNLRFDSDQINIGFSWNYSPKVMTSFSYNSTSGAGIVGRYSSDQYQNLKNESFISSVRYEISPVCRTTFSSSLRRTDGSGKGHSFSLLLEQDRWLEKAFDLSVAADFFASKFYRTYLFKTALYGKAYSWRIRSEVQLMSQSFRPDNHIFHSYYIIAEASRKIMKNNYLDGRVELTTAKGKWGTYAAIDYTIRF